MARVWGCEFDSIAGGATMQFHHYSLEVSNLAKSKAFYLEMLNFQEEMNVKILDEDIIFLLKEGFRLELVENKQLRKHIGSVHLCFQVEYLDTIIQRMARLGLEPTEGPSQFENGWKNVFYKGPDGELLEFLELHGKDIS